VARLRSCCCFPVGVVVVIVDGADAGNGVCTVGLEYNSVVLGHPFDQLVRAAVVISLTALRLYLLENLTRSMQSFNVPLHWVEITLVVGLNLKCSDNIWP
jgi:hypothetical protein